MTITGALSIFNTVFEQFPEFDGNYSSTEGIDKIKGGELLCQQ